MKELLSLVWFCSLPVVQSFIWLLCWWSKKEKKQKKTEWTLDWRRQSRRTFAPQLLLHWRRRCRLRLSRRDRDEWIEDGGWGKGLEHQQKFSLGSHLAAVGGVAEGLFSPLRIRKGGQPILSWAGAAGPLSRTKEIPAPFIYCLWNWTEWCYKYVVFLII